ncbi:Hypothetical predicted protein [Mytilus galloprovincialis]|uniref:C-type lectin domain-containing protein n=1 Tax=Mytilus galloprovincialis TaxID=29158 RepID=A0A8B6FTA0_MYTGA|nr:Hypothetical predicted protein [Mytilus galloprovincialis]
MKSWKIILSIVRSVVLFLFMFEFSLAKLNICNLINTNDKKITPSSSTLKIETAPSSMACSIMCCNLESCCYASYDNKTRQCILDESCCLQSELTGDALMMKKSTAFWLGGTDIEKEGDWIWSTSQTNITFNDWHVGEPDNWNDQHHCLLMTLRFNLEWADRSCGDINRFICEKTYWLGGTDIENEGDWMWSTSQTDITFADWGDGQPRNSDGNEHCLQMKYEYGLTWNDDPCIFKKRFVCEKIKNVFF